MSFRFVLTVDHLFFWLVWTIFVRKFLDSSNSYPLAVDKNTQKYTYTVNVVGLCGGNFLQKEEVSTMSQLHAQRPPEHALIGDAEHSPAIFCSRFSRGCCKYASQITLFSNNYNYGVATVGEGNVINHFFAATELFTSASDCETNLPQIRKIVPLSRFHDESFCNERSFERNSSDD